MRVAVLACIFLAPSILGAAEPSTPTPPVPMNPRCLAEAKRDLDEYFRNEFHAREVFIDIEPVFVSRTKDSQRPAYYLWLRVSTADAQMYQSGAARVTTGEDLKCNVTGFIPKKDILALRERLGTYFPPELVPKILLLAETPQK